MCPILMFLLPEGLEAPSGLEGRPSLGPRLPAQIAGTPLTPGLRVISTSDSHSSPHWMTSPGERFSARREAAGTSRRLNRAICDADETADRSIRDIFTGTRGAHPSGEDRDPLGL